jgi:dTDP-glucose pyrophosphorylase
VGKRINLIPMAGVGQRFVDAGFTQPKPLLDVAGKPMIMRAAESLPQADEWIFVCRDFHIKKNHIDRELIDMFPNARVLSVDHLTEGQACTCLLAKDYLNHDDSLTIGACDNAMTYSLELFDHMMQDEQVDAMIWTFRNNPAVLQNPKMYGWVSVSENNSVQGVSCKIPISENPMNDHAVIGSFTFKKASDFVDCTEAMIDKNIRINNEFYMDVVMDVAVQRGLKVKVFEVDKYVCWGTPNDLGIYNYWLSYFRDKGLC